MRYSGKRNENMLVDAAGNERYRDTKWTIHETNVNKIAFHEIFYSFVTEDNEISFLYVQLYLEMYVNIRILQYLLLSTKVFFSAKWNLLMKLGCHIYS